MRRVMGDSRIPFRFFFALRECLCNEDCYN